MTHDNLATLNAARVMQHHGAVHKILMQQQQQHEGVSTPVVSFHSLSCAPQKEGVCKAVLILAIRSGWQPCSVLYHKACSQALLLSQLSTAVPDYCLASPRTYAEQQQKQWCLCYSSDVDDSCTTAAFISAKQFRYAIQFMLEYGEHALSCMQQHLQIMLCRRRQSRIW